MYAKELVKGIQSCPNCKIIKRNKGYELNLCEEHSELFKRYLERGRKKKTE